MSSRSIVSVGWSRPIDSARVSTATAKLATAGLSKGLATERIRNIAMGPIIIRHPGQTVKLIAARFR